MLRTSENRSSSASTPRSPSDDHDRADRRARQNAGLSSRSAQCVAPGCPCRRWPAARARAQFAGASPASLGRQAEQLAAHPRPAACRVDQAQPITLLRCASNGSREWPRLPVTRFSRSRALSLVRPVTRLRTSVSGSVHSSSRCRALAICAPWTPNTAATNSSTLSGLSVSRPVTPTLMFWPAFRPWRDSLNICSRRRGCFESRERTIT